MDSPLRIAVAYDATPSDPGRGEPRDAVSRRGVRESLAAVVDALRGQGHRPLPWAIALPISRTLDRLDRIRPDLIFNLCEGLNDDAAHEADFAGLLALTGIPFTGATAETLSLALHKPRAKAILSAGRLPVVPGVTCAAGDQAEQAVSRAGIPAPWIVKPSREDAGIGIDAASVVDSAAPLRARVAYVTQRYRQPALIEHFVEGREFQVSVVGQNPRHLFPVAEIDFSGMPPTHPNILTYEAKWSAGSAADRGSVPVCPARIDAALSDRLTTLAEEAVVALGGRDVTRVDFRVDRSGQAFILEVNPNPDLSPSAGVARQAAAQGWSYPRLIELICREAWSRKIPAGTERSALSIEDVAGDGNVQYRDRKGAARAAH